MLSFQQNKAWLAPLAGYSDIAFRALCRNHGAVGAFTEMVSTKGILYGSRGTASLLARSASDDPLVVQIFSSDTASTAYAMDYLLQEGFSYFDLNVGCSVRKVVKTGCGAHLLRTPQVLVDVIRTMVSYAPAGHVGCKIRMGYEYGDTSYKTLVPLLEDCGVGWISVHPRYAKQGYAGQANWDVIAEIVQQASVPILASGDLFTPIQAKQCLEYTGASAVLFARGALHSPAIFEEFSALMEGRMFVQPKISSMIAEHVQLLAKHFPVLQSIAKLRSIISRYCKGQRYASVIREKLNIAKTYADIDTLIAIIASYE